jgi:DNA-binding response OmpR family regulator
LCIHEDPAQLSLLRESGYELLTAGNAADGLRLFLAVPVDAVVLEQGMSIRDGFGMAAELKRIRPDVPVVMLVDDMEVASDVVASADALVAKADGAHFLWATVHFILKVKPVQVRERAGRNHRPVRLARGGRSGDGKGAGQTRVADPGVPVSVAAIDWQGIGDGSVKF